jgi:hypothetical protein
MLKFTSYSCYLGNQLPDLGLGHGSDIVTTTDELSAEEDSGNGSTTGELGEVVLDLVWGLVVLLPGIKRVTNLRHHARRACLLA